MCDNPIFENYPFTIYDEHTPTVLELLSKQYAQLVALGNEFNQLDKVEAIRKGYATVWPSGDESGQADRLAIQTALDTNKVVHLVEGVYYLDKGIMMGAGYQLIGAGINTEIRTAFTMPRPAITKKTSVSFDHILLKDFHLVNPEGIPGEIGIQLQGTDKEPYTGARYSVIEGVRISGFTGTGILMKGAWSTTLRKVRTLNCPKGFAGTGLLNNINIDNCEFTHGTYGVHLTCANSTEMYGIRINETNFEGNTTAGVYAEGVTGLALVNCYSENTPRVFNVNSCPMFTVNGGRFSGVELFGSVTSTAYTSAKFVNPKCTIENANIEATGNRPDLLYLDGGVKNSIVRNNRVISSTTGAYMLTDFGGVVHRKHRYITDPVGIRYSEDYMDDYPIEMATNECAILSKFHMTLISTNIPKDVAYYLYYDAPNGDRVKIGQTATLKAGTHSMETIAMSFPEKMKFTDTPQLFIVPSVDVGASIQFYMDIEFQVADPGFSEEV